METAMACCCKIRMRGELPRRMSSSLMWEFQKHSQMSCQVLAQAALILALAATKAEIAAAANQPVLVRISSAAKRISGHLAGKILIAAATQCAMVSRHGLGVPQIRFAKEMLVLYVQKMQIALAFVSMRLAHLASGTAKPATSIKIAVVMGNRSRHRVV
ncbi:hypothetical protein ACHAWF_010738 [Thalassiosira exigua]